MIGKKSLWLFLLIIISVMVLLVVPIAAAQSGDGYDLTWNTVDNGGEMFSVGGGYSMGSTIGQPDAGTLSGGGYTLAGGFWGGIAQFNIFLPLILRN